MRRGREMTIVETGIIEQSKKRKNKDTPKEREFGGIRKKFNH